MRRVCGGGGCLGMCLLVKGLLQPVTWEPYSERLGQSRSGSLANGSGPTKTQRMSCADTRDVDSTLRVKC